MVGGYLEVGLNNEGEIVVNHPDLKPDADGVGHIVLSPEQARNLAELLLKHAAQSERDSEERRESERRRNVVPVDRSAQCLANGSPVTPDHREIGPDGMQRAYVVLSAAERAKGFVRPVRRTYIHVGINPKMSGIVLVRPGEHGCGTRTTMGQSIAETYARDPGFYSGTFCCLCKQHRPLEEFVWEGTTEIVGS